MKRCIGRKPVRGIDLSCIMTALAGKFFEMQSEGIWWADATEEQMPESEEVQKSFECVKHDFCSQFKAKVLADFKDPYGDR